MRAEGAKDTQIRRCLYMHTRSVCDAIDDNTAICQLE